MTKYGSIQEPPPTTTANEATPLQAATTTFKSIVGGGVIALPYAFERAGLFGGLVLLALVYLATDLTSRQLLECAQRIRARTGASSHEEICYLQIGREAMGQTGERLVTASLLACQLGACCSYFVFIGTNLASVLPWLSREAIVMGVAFPIIAGLCLFRSTTYLAPTSHFGNAALVTGIASVFIYGFRESPPALEHMDAWPASAAGLYAFFGISVFTFSAHCEILSISHFTQDKDGYVGVMSKVLAACAVLYALFGAVAYSFFGEDTNAIIFLNLGQGAEVKVVKFCMSLMIVFNYPLTMFPTVQTIEEYVAIGSIGRILLVAATAVVAVVVRNFGIITAISGGCNGLIAFVLPPLFYMYLVQGFSWVNWVIIAVGLVGSVGSIVDGVRSLS